ncbi:MAG: hypothetical protein AAFN18_19175 [Cyanobacteria bacterium J06554_6]
MVSPAPLTPNRVEKALKQSVNQVLTEQDMRPSTRSGNKELRMLLKRAAQASFTSLEEVKTVGQTLGTKIVDISKQRKKTSLDAGVVRTISLDKGWPALIGLPEMPGVLTGDRTSSIASRTAADAKPATPVQPPTDVPTDAEDTEPDSAPVEAAAEAVVETAATEVTVGTITGTVAANPEMATANAEAAEASLESAVETAAISEEE